MVFAGELTETLHFFHIEEVQSESGYKSSEEVEYLVRKAQRLKNKENFVVDAGELFHNVLLTFRLRFNKEITETDIVKYEDNRYRIISLDKFPRDNEIVIKIEKINE